MRGKAGLIAGCVLVISAYFVLGSADDSGAGPIRFRNVTAKSGIDFVLENSPTEAKHLPETMAGGVAAFDFDGDGLTDIYFTNGASMPPGRKDSPRFSNRLYRNLGGMRFQDVTAAAGLKGSGFAIGAAAADYDNDGRVDLFVAGVGNNTLYHNRGDGTFEDVTERAGIAKDAWSVGAAWLDYDNDGKLDLFVVNYLKWSPDFDRFCGDSRRQIRAYCHPRFFEGLANRLYHNEGNGRFREVSAESSIGEFIGKGMAAAIADYDGDGLPDIFVTNDKMPNFLFHNLGDGKFEEVALKAGVALPDNGNEISSMGADFRDYDNDGRPDVFETALSGETFPLFRNRGGGVFGDIGYSTRMSPISRNYAGWGAGLIDFDNDGWKDAFTANGHVNDRIEAFEATQYKQHNAIFRNAAGRGFEDVSGAAGPEFQIPRAHRGCAFADFNGDGRIDVVVTALGDAPELWENVSPPGNTYLIVHPIGTRSNHDGIGSTVVIGDRSNTMTSAVGYASSSHYGVHFGTGKRSVLDRVEIRWPSGARQALSNVRANQALTVREPER